MIRKPGVKPFLFAISLSIAALCVLPFSCRITDSGGGATDPADLLPLDNDISGFLRKGSAAIMTDQQTIFNAIDGEAQRYIDYGFAEGVKQLFSNGGVDIDVQIFNQGNEANAEALFERFRPSSSDQIGEKNPVVLVDLSLPNGYSIMYAKSGIFMRVTTTEKTDFALNMAKQFYRNIDNKIAIE